MARDAGTTRTDGTGVILTDEELLNRLEYLADVLQELQVMTGSAGGATLNGLLALTRCEALLRIKLLKGKAAKARES